MIIAPFIIYDRRTPIEAHVGSWAKSNGYELVRIESAEQTVNGRRVILYHSIGSRRPTAFLNDGQAIFVAELVSGDVYYVRRGRFFGIDVSDDFPTKWLTRGWMLD